MSRTTEELAGSLFSAIRNADLDRLVPFLEGLSSAERAALRKACFKEVQEGLREWRDYLGGTREWTKPEEYRRLRQKLGHLFKSQEKKNAMLNGHRLVVVGIANRKDVEQALFSSRLNITWSGTSLPPERQFHYRAGLILARREDPWARDVLLDLIGFESEGWFHPQLYALGRHLIQTGLLPEAEVLPPLSRQARRLGLGVWGNTPFTWDELGRRIAWTALEDRHEPFLASVDDDGKLTERILAEVAAGGFRRDALLGLALRRLAEGSRAHDTNWWGRLLEKLKPADAEWAAHAEAALDLIGAPNARAVSAGLASAGPLLKSGVVEPATLVSVLSLVVSNPSATSAKVAVNLLRQCAAKDPGLRLEALTAALQGLQHPKAAVHDAVFKWLEGDPSWRDDPEALYAVLDAQVAVAPAVAARLKPLLPDDAPALAPEPAPAAAEEEDLRPLLQRELAAAVDPERRSWLQALEKALDGTGPLPEARLDLGTRWRSDAPFDVPQAPEETARLMLKVTATGFDYRDWERVCAGVRLPVSPEERAMLARLLDPLLRLRQQMDGTAKAQFMVSWPDAWPVLMLAEAWLQVPSGPFPHRSFGSQSGDQCSRARRMQLDATRAALQRGDCTPPLGAPTHASGWLDPLVLAERLTARKDLPEEELWELSAALYRLPLDPGARAEAWQRLEAQKGRFGRLPELMLTAALAPGRVGDQAAADLIGWFRGTAGGLKRVQDQASRVIGFVKVLTGGDATARESGRAAEGQLRLLTCALRCRYGPGAIPGMEAVAHLLPRQYQDLLKRHGQAAVRPAQDEEGRFDWDQFMNAFGWHQLADVIPELRPYEPPTWGETDAPTFSHPAIAFSLAEQALSRNDNWGQGLPYAAAAALLRRPYCPVAPALPLLIRRIPENQETAAAIVELLAVALRDGRLRLHDLIQVLVPALGHKDAKPRALLNAMQLLAGQYPPFREAAAVAVERALPGMDAITPNDRVLALEALLAWRSEAGRAVEDPAARAALEALREKSKSSRGGTLAKQLLDLPPRLGPTSAATCLTADIRAMLCADVSPP